MLLLRCLHHGTYLCFRVAVRTSDRKPGVVFSACKPHPQHWFPRLVSKQFFLNLFEFLLCFVWLGWQQQRVTRLDDLNLEVMGFYREREIVCDKYARDIQVVLAIHKERANQPVVPELQVEAASGCEFW